MQELKEHSPTSSIECNISKNYVNILDTVYANLRKEPTKRFQVPIDPTDLIVASFKGLTEIEEIYLKAKDGDNLDVYLVAKGDVKALVSRIAPIKMELIQCLKEMQPCPIFIDFHIIPKRQLPLERTYKQIYPVPYSQHHSDTFLQIISYGIESGTFAKSPTE